MRMRSRSAPPPAEMPTIAPVESDLDALAFAMEDVFDEVGFAPAEVVAEAVLEGSVANDEADAADVDKPVTDAAELVREVEAELLVAVADDEDEEDPLDEVELDLPVLLDALLLDDLLAELDLVSCVEDSVTVTLDEMTVSVANTERRSLVVNSEVVTNVETETETSLSSSSSSALRWPAFTGMNPSSTAAIAGPYKSRKKEAPLCGRARRRRIKRIKGGRGESNT